MIFRFPTVVAIAEDSTSQGWAALIAGLTAGYTITSTAMRHNFSGLAHTTQSTARRYEATEANNTARLNGTDPAHSETGAVVAVPPAPAVLAGVTPGHAEVVGAAVAKACGGTITVETGPEEYSRRLHHRHPAAYDLKTAYRQPAGVLAEYPRATEVAIGFLDTWKGGAAAAAKTLIGAHGAYAAPIAAGVAALDPLVAACIAAHEAACAAVPTPAQFQAIRHRIEQLAHACARDHNPITATQLAHAVQDLLDAWTATAAGAAAYDDAVAAAQAAHAPTTPAATPLAVPTSPDDIIIGPHTGPHITPADTTTPTDATDSDEFTKTTDYPNDPDTSDNPGEAPGKSSLAHPDPDELTAQAVHSASTPSSVVPLSPALPSPGGAGGGSGGGVPGVGSGGGLGGLGGGVPGAASVPATVMPAAPSGPASAPSPARAAGGGVRVPPIAPVSGAGSPIISPAPPPSSPGWRPAARCGCW